MTNAYKTTFHRDGTVTIWNVYEQRWMNRIRPANISDRIYASLNPDERERVRTHGTRRYGVRCFPNSECAGRFSSKSAAE